MDVSIPIASQGITVLLAQTLEILAGKSKDEAMNDYITKVKQLQEEAAAS
ncbi:hypothetical protein Zm00014a_011120 [Zea mays]|jgi:hypothetical protein|uniref:Uncharacterized protein n=1 Tax=Zea mays TaxID=4577 RepID=A0A3L6G7U7_MAIZE|nr:hypothetical protein Zm00014a_011120 [Zea mays]